METVLVVSERFDDAKDIVYGYVEEYKKKLKDCYVVKNFKRDHDEIEIRVVSPDKEQLNLVKWVKYDDYMKENLWGYMLIYSKTCVRVEVDLGLCTERMVKTVLDKMPREKVVFTPMSKFSQGISLDRFIEICEGIKLFYGNLDIALGNGCNFENFAVLQTEQKLLLR